MHSACCRARPNLALIKYWGKDDSGMPANASLSLNLYEKEYDSFYSECRVTLVEHHDFGVQMNLNGGSFEKARTKILGMIEKNFKEAKNIRIESLTTFALSAGLASSASGIASLVGALSLLFPDSSKSMQDLAMIAAEESGSAARSIPTLEHQNGNNWELMFPTCDAVLFNPEDRNLKTFRLEPTIAIALLLFDEREKEVGSSEGMQMCRDTSPFYMQRIRTASSHLEQLAKAISDQESLLKHAEIICREALNLHAVCLSSWPPMMYMSAESWNFIQRFASKERTEFAFTIDAGPNLFILGPFFEKIGRLLGEISTANAQVYHFVTCKQ